jgi:hypothetical protein
MNFDAYDYIKALFFICCNAFPVSILRFQIMLFCFLTGIGILGNYTSVKAMNLFKSFIQCGMIKNIVVKNFTLVGHSESTDIYEYYLKYFRNDTDLQYSNQASGTQFFCQ